MGNAISYQGQLHDNGQPVNDSCDFRFSLWNAASGPTQIGGATTNLTVDQGMFIVDNLDFGATAFNGDPRWLQIEVRCPTGVGSYIILDPRTAILAAPYALYSGDSDKLDGLQASNFYSSSGGDLWGNIQFKNTIFGDWQIGSGGVINPIPPYNIESQWFHISDPSDLSIPYRILIDKTTGDVGIAKRLGIGTDSPETTLQVLGDSTFNGMAHFMLGLGQISMSTPGGWPGIIAYAPNGHRREISVKDDRFSILSSTTSSPSPNEAGIIIAENGYVGIGRFPSYRLDVAGPTRMDVLHITGGDLAEPFIINGEPQPGMAVVIDPNNPGELRLSDSANDRLVAGCISGANGLDAGVILYQELGEQEDAFPVALSGRVYCWADASYGVIQPGDLLTTSDTPGHLMAVQEYDQAHGAIVGKAMQSLETGQGLILILVTLQ